MLVSPVGSTREGPGSKLMWLWAGLDFSRPVGQRASGPCALAGVWPEAALWSLLCGPPVPQFASSGRECQEDAVGRTPAHRCQSFCNPISEVMPHCVCYILFARNKLLGPACTQGGRLPECVIWGAGATGGRVTSCLPHRHLQNMKR